jgi:hypothetical protein
MVSACCHPLCPCQARLRAARGHNGSEAPSWPTARLNPAETSRRAGRHCARACFHSPWISMVQLLTNPGGDTTLRRQSSTRTHTALRLPASSHRATPHTAIRNHSLLGRRRCDLVRTRASTWSGPPRIFPGLLRWCWPVRTDLLSSLADSPPVEHHHRKHEERQANPRVEQKRDEVDD